MNKLFKKKTSYKESSNFQFSGIRITVMIMINLQYHSCHRWVFLKAPEAGPGVDGAKALSEDQRRAFVRGRPQASLHGLGEESVEPRLTSPVRLTVPTWW